MPDQHTPGPWAKSSRQGNGWDTKWLIKHKSEHVDGGIFCEVVPLHITAEGMATGEANAHLIAAAPDLLAALRAITPHAIGHDKYGCKGNCTVCTAIKRADAAVAKATGETA